MSASASLSVTALLHEAEEKPEALDRLLPLLYDELHRIARRERQRVLPGETLNTTALVHEAYVRLVDGPAGGWNGRAHFLGTAARAMRHLLVDDARRRRRHKRGGGQVPLPIEAAHAVAAPADDLVALDESLARLERLDDRLGRIVECRYFAGLSVEETAAALSLSSRTVERSWQTARAWLFRDLYGRAA